LRGVSFPTSIGPPRRYGMPIGCLWWVSVRGLLRTSRRIFRLASESGACAADKVPKCSERWGGRSATFYQRSAVGVARFLRMTSDSSTSLVANAMRLRGFLRWESRTSADGRIGQCGVCPARGVTESQGHQSPRVATHGATVMVAAGVSLRAVQTIGGWSSPRMVERYAHVDDAELARAVRLTKQQTDAATQTATAASGTAGDSDTKS